MTTLSSNFAYERQSGALNESMSDVFAIINKHREGAVLANSPDTDWNVANIVNMGNNELRPLRSLSNPGRAFVNHPILGDDNLTHE